MVFSRFSKSVLAISISILISNVPQIAVATVAVKMIPAHVVLAELSRVETEREIQNFLQNSNVQKELIMHGLTAEEASARIANLSDLEIRQLSSQLQEARAGGDILVTVLIVVLILFLLNRI